MRPQVSPEHYAKASYDHKGRLCAYWHQIDEVRKRAPDRILEVGCGNGFVTHRLGAEGIDVTTVDIDRGLRPTVAGSVDKLPLVDQMFYLALCCDVLEYLTFELVSDALSEVHRVTQRVVIVALPDRSAFLRVLCDVPMLGSVRWFFTKPRLFTKGPSHQFDGQHHWELGKRGYPLKRFVDLARDVGFVVEDCFWVFEWPYQRFLILKRRRHDVR